MKRLAAILFVALATATAGADPSERDPAVTPAVVPVEPGSRIDPLVSLPDPAAALASHSLTDSGAIFAHRNLANAGGAEPWAPVQQRKPGFLDTHETDAMLSNFSLFGPAGLIYLTFFCIGVFLKIRYAKKRSILEQIEAARRAAAAQQATQAAPVSAEPAVFAEAGV